MNSIKNILAVILFFSLLSIGCKDESDSNELPAPAPTREDAIPDDAVKMTPATDLFPPVLHSTIWSDPAPLLGPVNTAGVEDSPVISADGNTMYFFFTPDASVAPGLQASDGVSGVWWTRKLEGAWTEPERLLLYSGEALDSPLYFLNDTLWFASARAGNYGDIDIYTVAYHNYTWGSPQNAGSLFNMTWDIGQLCLTSDGSNLIYDHLNDAGTNYDLLEVQRNFFFEPQGVGDEINTGANEWQPCLTPDDTEFWFTRDQSGFGHTGPSLFRCMASDSGWAVPDEVLSNLSGDVTIDAQGNLYFTHIFLDDSLHIIESDIYVCYHR